VTIAWLGQAAACQRGTVLPRDYLTGDDVAYLPGVAPEPSAPPERAPSIILPIALAGAVLLAWMALR
jgi:hypothetical protein